MEIFQVLGVGLVALMLYLILQEQKSNTGIFVVITFGVLVFLYVMDKMAVILNTLLNVSADAGVNVIYLTTIFKIIGIAYLTEFVGQLCRDAGSGALALKIEFAAKVMILALAMPVLQAILQSILQLLG